MEVSSTRGRSRTEAAAAIKVFLMFEGIGKQVRLKLTDTRAFGNGNVLLSYEPTAWSLANR